MSALHLPAGTDRAGLSRWVVPAAVFIALHGLAHGVAVSRGLKAANDGTSADYLAGAWNISGAAGLRVLAVIWAVVGIGVVVAAVLLATRPGSARGPVTVALAASLVLCLVALWAAVAGAVIDAVLLAVVLWPRSPLFGADEVVPETPAG